MDCRDLHVISLGYNCEVSFRIEDFFGELDSYLFSWSYELDRERFIEALNSIDDVFQGPTSLEEDHMFRCDRYQIKFHPRYELLPKDGPVTNAEYQTALNELKERIQYLKEKTKSRLEDSSRKVFLIKIESKGEMQDIAYIKKLHETIKHYDHSELVCIFERKSLTPGIQALETDTLKIRTLKKFAPTKHTDIMGDILGWRRILTEVTGQSSNVYYSNVWDRRKIVFPLMVIHKIHRIQKF